MKSCIKEFLPGGNYSPGHTGRINSVCFHKKDSPGLFTDILASGGWDQKVIFYDIRSNKIIGTIKGPYICGDSIDLKDYMVLTGSNYSNNKLQMWDLRTYKQLELKIKDDMSNAFRSDIYSLQFCEGKKMFAYGGANVNQMRIYQMDEDVDQMLDLVSCTRYMEKPCYSLDFSSSGKFMAYSGADSTLRILNI
jgi:WD40 repeat protein